jgi:hypothetical protein
VRLGATKAMLLEGMAVACPGTASWPLPHEGSIGTLCHNNAWVKSIGVAAGVGACEGSTRATEPGALATPRPPPRLALPTGSTVLAPGKGTVAADPREGGNQLSERATKEGIGKDSAKKLAMLGKRCAPIGMMVAIAGSLPGRSPAILPAPTHAPRIDGKI